MGWGGVYEGIGRINFSILLVMSHAETIKVTTTEVYGTVLHYLVPGKENVDLNVCYCIYTQLLIHLWPPPTRWLVMMQA